MLRSFVYLAVRNLPRLGVNCGQLRLERADDREQRIDLEPRVRGQPQRRGPAQSLWRQKVSLITPMNPWACVIKTA